MGKLAPEREGLKDQLLMRISDIFEIVKNQAGSNAKKAILLLHKDNDLLKKALFYSLDPFSPFHIVKVPKVKYRLEFPMGERNAWEEFFDIVDECASRKVTGNAALDRVHACFSSVREDDEKWMRKVLKKHLAIGVSTKSVNKVFPGLVSTFEIALAQKFEEKRIEEKNICVEPKLDGIRCFAVVRNGQPTLYARSGKEITNFNDTVGRDLKNVPDGCYDGELMGEDFISLMRQAYRKENVCVDDTYFAIFDYLSLREWDKREAVKRCEDRYIDLLHYVMPQKFQFLNVVERIYCLPDYSLIKKLHDKFVADGYEGVMIKDLDAPYKFGRGPEVMKLKEFHDVDLKIQALLEGTGRHTGKLGSVVVVYNGVDVQVGSGFSDELRESIWSDPEKFVGRMIEVRYQEETPDGSLRFPTFVCFRNDR